MADVAYMILNGWQGLGLGTLLQNRMAEYARSKGVRGVSADILAENKAMLKMDEKCGKVQMKLADWAYTVEILFD